MITELKTKAEFIHLLDEAILAADRLTKQIARMDLILAKEA